MARRSGSDEIRKGVFDRIVSEFDYQRVNGLTSAPPITQNPTRKTTEPFIYVYSVDSNEVDPTKDSTAREYTVYVEVCTRYNSYGGGQRQVNRMVDEAVRALRNGGYPDLSSVGYNIYNLTIGEIRDFTFKETGANYYKATVEVFVTADFVGLPQDTVPVQEAIYTYEGFTFEPVDNRIEFGDNGTITGALTYPSGNAGWNFNNVLYALTPGSAGTLSGGVLGGNILTVGFEDEPLGLVATLAYQFSTDSSVTTTITDTDTFPRIRSLRYGSSSNTSFVSADLDVFEDFNIDYGVTDLTDLDIALEQTLGEHLYIIQDAGDPHITFIANTSRKDSSGANFIDQFTITTVNGYRIYIRDAASTITGTNNITIRT